MKNYFYFLFCFILSVGTSFANALPPAESKFIKFEISNYEISNLDSGFIGARFQQNDCETGGYSLFNPFYEQPDLIRAKVNSFMGDGEVKITLAGNILKDTYILRNIVVNEDGSMADLDIIKGNVTYESKFHGINLSEEFILNQFSIFQNSSLFPEEDCGPCIPLAILAIAALCENASSGCVPCNGTLVVGACSCSCTPK